MFGSSQVTREKVNEQFHTTLQFAAFKDFFSKSKRLEASFYLRCETGITFPRYTVVQHGWKLHTGSGLGRLSHSQTLQIKITAGSTSSTFNLTMFLLRDSLCLHGASLQRNSKDICRATREQRPLQFLEH